MAGDGLACPRPGVPVCLVTGFLGAGKTTLLNHVLRNRRGLRAAVFVNEFGALEIDASLIRWQGAIDEARVVTLDNGCICCEVNADLARQLQRVLRGRAEASAEVDFIIIETSGVCDPGPVLTTLERIDGLAFSTHLDSVLAVVDTSSFDTGALAPAAASTLGLQATARAQVSHSDIVLLNKCDLLGGAGSPRAARAEEALRELLASERPGHPPRILRTEHAAVDLALITALPLRAVGPAMAVGSEGALETPPKRPRPADDVPSSGLAAAASEVPRPHARGGDEKGLAHGAHGAHAAETLRAHARSFTYTAKRPFDPLKFEDWVEAGGPPAGICRAKGLLWMRGIPRHVIFQMAGSRTNPFETVAAGEAPTDSRLVFIGEANQLRDGDEAAVVRALDACLC